MFQNSPKYTWPATGEVNDPSLNFFPKAPSEAAWGGSTTYANSDGARSQLGTSRPPVLVF